MRQEIVPVVLEFKNAALNSNLSLVIVSPHIGWSLGGDYFESGGFNLTLDNNVQPSIAKIALSYSTLTISTTNEAEGFFVDFKLMLFLTVYGEKWLQGIATLNSECQVYHVINNREPSTWMNGLMTAGW